MAYRDIVIADGPEGYYELDETSGTNAADSSGNANDATYVNGPGLNKTALVTGSTASVECSVSGIAGHHVLLPAATILPSGSNDDFCLEFWIRPNAFAFDRTLYDVFDASAVTHFIRVELLSNGDIRFRIQQGGGAAQVVANDAGMVFNGSNIFHIVCQSDGGTMEVFVDSVIDTTTANRTGTNPAGLDTNALMGVEALSGSVFGDYNGLFDECAVYHKALTDAEILEHFNAGVVTILGRTAAIDAQSGVRGQLSVTRLFSADLIAALNQQTVEPNMRVTIKTNPTFEFSTSVSVLAGALPGVAKVTPIAFELDTFSGKFQISQCQVDMNDEAIRTIADVNRLKNKSIKIIFGTEDLAPVSFGPFFNGVIADVIPTEGGVALHCEDVLGLVADRNVGGKWMNKHFFQIIRGILHMVGVPSELINEPSFDPGNHPTISHFNTARAVHGDQVREIFDAESAFKLIEEILEIIPVRLFVREDGKLTLVTYDPVKAAVQTWNDDIVDEFDQDKTYANLQNRINIWFNWEGAAASDDYESLFMLEDTTSQADFAFPGLSKNVQDKPDIKSKWVGVMSVLESDITNAIGQSAQLHSGLGSSFCGARKEDDAIAGGAELGSGRSAFWLIQANNGDKEIVRIDAAFTFDDEQEVFEPELDLDSDVGLESTGAEGDPHAPGGTGFEGPSNGTYDASKGGTGGGYISINKLTGVLAARGLFGTSATAFSAGARVYDYTIPVLQAQQLLNRRKGGMAILTLTTNANGDQVNVLVGDFVRLDNDVFLKFGFDGILAADRKWEIVSKEMDLQDDKVRIRWVLVEVIPVSTSTIGIGGVFKPNITQKGGILFRGGTQPGLLNGGELKLESGVLFSLKASTGTGLGGSSFSAKGTQASDVEIDVTGERERDSWISYDTHSHRYVRRRVAVGAAKPAISDIEFEVALFEFSGGALSGPIDTAKHGKLIPSGLAIGGAAKTLNGAVAYRIRDIDSPHPPPMWRMPPGQVWNTNAEIHKTTADLESADAGIRLLDDSVGASDIIYGPFPIQEGEKVAIRARWRSDAIGGGDLVTGTVEFLSNEGLIVSAITVFTKVGSVVDTYEDGDLENFAAPANARFAQLRISKALGGGFNTIIDKASVDIINRAEGFSLGLRRGFFAYWTGGGTVSIPDATDLDNIDASEFIDNGSISLVSGTITPSVVCLYSVTVRVLLDNVPNMADATFAIRRSDGQIYKGPTWVNATGGPMDMPYFAEWKIPVSAGQTLTIRNVTGGTRAVTRTRDESWISGGILYPRN